MDRKSFLKELKRTLWWRMPPEELSVVLEDYNEYFDSGIAEGKSETELCAQFGRPGEIATDIVAESGSKYYSVALTSMGLCAGLLLIAIITMVRPSWMFNTVYSEYILHFAVLVLSALSILLIRRTIGTAVLVKTSRLMTVMHVIVYSLCLFSFAAIFIVIEAAVTDTWFTSYIAFLDPNILGPTTSFISAICIVLVVLLWLSTIYRSAALRRWQLAFIPASAVMLSLLISLICLLGQLSDPASLVPAVIYSVQLALLQLLTVILVFIPRKGAK